MLGELLLLSRPDDGDDSKPLLLLNSPAEYVMGSLAAGDPKSIKSLSPMSRKSLLFFSTESTPAEAGKLEESRAVYCWRLLNAPGFMRVLPVKSSISLESSSPRWSMGEEDEEEMRS